MGVALSPWLPGHAGGGLRLQRHPGVVGQCGADWHIQPDNRQPVAMGAGTRHEHQWLTQPVVVVSIVVIVVLGVFHVLAPAPQSVLTVGANHLDPVVQLSLRDVQPVVDVTGEVWQRKGEQGLWV